MPVTPLIPIGSSRQQTYPWFGKASQPNSLTMTNGATVTFVDAQSNITQVFPGPAGVIQLFAGASAPPGYLFCDGASYATSSFPGLFAAIGYTWGGVGANFNVPDFRGRSPIGVGTGTYAGATAHPLAQTGGEESHTLTSPEMPTHGHNVIDPGHAHTYPNSGSAGGGPNLVEGAPNAGTGTHINSAIANVTLQNTGGSGAHNTYHPVAAVNFIIKF